MYCALFCVDLENGTRGWQVVVDPKKKDENGNFLPKKYPESMIDSIKKLGGMVVLSSELRPADMVIL